VGGKGGEQDAKRRKQVTDDQNGKKMWQVLKAKMKSGQNVSESGKKKRGQKRGDCLQSKKKNTKKKETKT